MPRKHTADIAWHKRTRAIREVLESPQVGTSRVRRKRKNDINHLRQHKCSRHLSEKERERERESRDRVCISREFYVRGSTRESTEQSANRHAASRMIAEDRGTSADDSLDLESLVDQHWLSCGTRWIRQVPQSTSGPVLRLIDIWITHLQA